MAKIQVLITGPIWSGGCGFMPSRSRATKPALSQIFRYNVANDASKDIFDKVLAGKGDEL
ncbi:MAG: hypothetical protein Q9192_008718, partial [Flavoplaca navasiana]